MSPAQLALARLFEPFADWLTRWPALPRVAELDAFADEIGRPQSASGAAIHFVAEDAANYEKSIFDTGRVPTREGSWHDFFNALVWLRFPKTKAALNHRHVRHLREDAPRGPLRDAATQFDECGVVVLSLDRQVNALLDAQAWVEALWDRRAALRGTRFLVFGHASLDVLREPHFGLCGKALYLDAPASLAAAPLASWIAFADDTLAVRFKNDGFCASPRALAPLPLLGVPGVTAANECRDYYLDTRQFRPRRP